MTRPWGAGWMKVMGSHSPPQEEHCPAGASLTPVSLNKFIHPSTHPLTHPSIHLSVHPSIHSPITLTDSSKLALRKQKYPSTHPPTCPTPLSLSVRWAAVPCLSSGLGQLHRPRVPVHRCTPRGSPSGSVSFPHPRPAGGQDCVLGGHRGPRAPLGP